MEGGGQGASTFVSSLSSKVNAAPFVPRGQQQQQQGQHAGENAGFSAGDQLANLSAVAGALQPQPHGGVQQQRNPYAQQAPGGQPVNLHKSSSTPVLRNSSVAAPPFVPGGAAGAAGRSLQTAVNAQPFVPSASESGAPRSTTLPPPQHQAQHVMGRAPGAPTPVASPQRGRGTRPGGPRIEASLPDSDDLLGMTALMPDAAAAAVAGQAGLGGMPGAAAFAHSSAMQQRYPFAAGKLPGQPFGGRAGGGRGVVQTGRAPLLGGRGPTGRGGMGGGRGRGGTVGYGANPHMVAAGKMHLAGRFMAEALRQELQQRSALIHAQADPEQEPRLPPMVAHFHSLAPLEDLGAAEEHPSGAYGLCTAVIKGISSVDAQAYALRRLDMGQGGGVSAEAVSSAQEAVGRWGALAGHPNIVPLRAVLLSADMGGSPGLFFVHDYFPGAVTLEQAHMHPTSTPSGLVRAAVSEAQLWGYLVQMAAALRAAHSHGLAFRAATLAPSKVLLVSTGRLRVGGCGVMDALAPEAGGQEEVAALQREDLAAVGGTLLTLACSGLGALPSLDVLSQHFSGELTQLLSALLSAPDGHGITSWQQLVSALGDRVFTELDGANAYSDTLMSECAREAENGRLLRLLVLLGCVVERPDGDMDAQWSETGDRYLLKLFRDFLLHQVDEDGAPVLEWGHVVEALNKLDAGVPERVLLMSRDETSLLVATYADLKRCLETAYAELRARAQSMRARAREGR